ncbi:fas-binding factor 1 [Microcaecilia unicolor]|uniref:Fas-binding factor 1 n=1 Tax=Microcaecilia unicolor TaxID=1415580 RepID=A0A6P7YGD6_9AMPH|nr:fas-binding factor 1 [Microcaecilia unicolor]XP_030064093.1 fas-binding factor 1 [Microcaecilia unicolor]
MAPKIKKGLKGSIDDVLGDLLDADDGVPVKSSKSSLTSEAVAGRPKSINSATSKKALLSDDFFSKLAQEAVDGAAEESDISDADPLALLERMKDMDDMDADLFGKKKPRSAPNTTSAKVSQRSSTIEDFSKPVGGPAGAEKGKSPAADERKPLSAPAGSGRQYRKFSFDELDDPLEGLLSDDDGGAPKKVPVTETIPVLEQNAPTPAAKEVSILSPSKMTARSPKKEDLTFEDDGDDLMDALGFGDSPKAQQKDLTGEEEVPRPARSKLDELLGRGTAAKLLERPVTGEQKEFKLDPKYQKKQEKEETWGDEDFAFGAYQPTMSSSSEGRQSRRQSVRFSAESINDLKSDHKSKPTTPASSSPARSSKNGADWLGLKDEDYVDFMPSSPVKETGKTNFVNSSVPSSPTAAKNPTSANRPPSGAKPMEQAVTKLKSSQSESNAGSFEEDNWLSNALSRKKAQMQGKAEEKRVGLPEHQGQEEVSEPSTQARKSASSPTALTQATITGARMETKPVISESPLPWENPQKAATSPAAADVYRVEPSRAVSSQRQAENVKASAESQLETLRPQFPTSGEYEKKLLALQVQLRESQTGPPAEMLASQARILDLETQIRKLELERGQQKMLLDSMQQHHQEDLKLVEDAHRSRLKVIEESYKQREERLQQENQVLAQQYLSRCQSAEQERSELLAQYQRRLTEFEQEKVKEVERIRELQQSSIQDMRRDHEEQLKRVKRLKDQEIDAVTSASSHTRSLNGVIEQMEMFSSKLTDLSYKVETTHHTTSHELEVGARQREGQLRVLQERLTQQQRDMEDERGRLQEVITKMEARLSEQTRLLEQERWRVTAEQSKVESLQRSLEEQRRVLTQQMSMEREEIERAKSALLDEQQSVMQKCTEERRKLAMEWLEFHAQQKRSQERAERDISRALQIDSQREGAIMSIAKEQADLKIQANELRVKGEQLTLAREELEQERQALRLEKERVNAAALRVRQKAEEIESMSKLSSQKYEEGQKALLEAQRVESEHQNRLRQIHQQMERLREQEQHMHQERLNMTQQRRQLDQLRHGIPVDSSLLLTKAPVAVLGTRVASLSTAYNLPSFAINSPQMSPAASASAGSAPSEFHAKLALLKFSAAQDRDFLEDERDFLETLKKSSFSSVSQTV